MAGEKIALTLRGVGMDLTPAWYERSERGVHARRAKIVSLTDVVEVESQGRYPLLAQIFPDTHFPGEEEKRFYFDHDDFIGELTTKALATLSHTQMASVLSVRFWVPPDGVTLPAMDEQPRTVRTWETLSETNKGEGAQQ